MGYFLPYEISIVKDALWVMKERLSIAITDSAVEGLLVHTLIMKKRSYSVHLY